MKGKKVFMGFWRTCAYYKPVIVEGDLKLGDIVRVAVKQVTKHDLRAELIESSQERNI